MNETSDLPQRRDLSESIHFFDITSHFIILFENDIVTTCRWRGTSVLVLSLQGEASLIRREVQIKAVQRDEDETKADLERDIRTFTRAAPGSVSNNTQIAASASESQHKHAGLPLWYPSIPSALGLLSNGVHLKTFPAFSAGKHLSVYVCKQHTDYQHLLIMCKKQQMCVFLALFPPSATKDSGKSFICTACVFSLPFLQVCACVCVLELANRLVGGPTFVENIMTS